MRAEKSFSMSLKIQIISDLHFEFGYGDIDFSIADVLILAGDVHVGSNGLDWIMDTVKSIPVIYVLGNHEYYKQSYPKLLYKLRDKAKGSNVHLLENESVVLDGIRFHGATLWTNFELFGDPQVAGYHSQQSMNDYKYIRRDPMYSKLRSIDVYNIHKVSCDWLKKSLVESNEKRNVVVTHHAPSKKSLPSHRQNDLLSAAYASNLEDMILETKPDLWIHGHIHTCMDYHVGKTRIICNPHGYLTEPYNGHNKKLIIEV